MLFWDMVCVLYICIVNNNKLQMSVVLKINVKLISA